MNNTFRSRPASNDPIGNGSSGRVSYVAAMDRFDAIVLGEPELCDDVSCKYLIMVMAGDEYLPGYAAEGPYLRKLHANAFKFQERTLNFEDLKRNRRKAEEPLNFGDLITFERKDEYGGYIHKFTRGLSNHPLFPRRIKDSERQLMVIGVLDRYDKGRMYAPPFGMVNMAIADMRQMIPNVAVKVWISVQENYKNNTITTSFSEYDSISPDDQYHVPDAPWNKGNEKFYLKSLGDSSDSEDDSRFVEIPNASLSTIKLGKSCLCTGRNTMLCDDLLDKQICVPLVKTELKIGNYYKCDLFYNRFEDVYMCYYYVRNDKEEIFKCKTYELLGKTALLFSVREEKEYPGVFKHERFGYVDDPDGILAMYHLSPFGQRNSCCRIFAFDDGPSKFGRFRVIEVEQERKHKMENYFQNQKSLTVEDANGVIISTDGHSIFATKHSTLKFRFSPETCKDWRCLAAGTKIKFTATMKDYNRAIFDVVEWRESESKPLKHTMRVDGTLWFRVDCEYSHNFPNMLRCKEFGILDDPKNQITFKPMANRVYDMWVTISSAPLDSSQRKERTFFYCVHRGEEPPVEKLPQMPRPQMSLEIESMHTNGVSSRSGSRFGGPSPSSSTRFGGPSNSSVPVQNREIPSIRLGAPSNSHIPARQSSQVSSTHFDTPSNSSFSVLQNNEGSLQSRTSNNVSMVEKMGKVQISEDLTYFKNSLSELQTPVAISEVSDVELLDLLEIAVAAIASKSCCRGMIENNCCILDDTAGRCPRQFVIRESIGKRGEMLNKYHPKLFNKMIEIVTSY